MASEPTDAISSIALLEEPTRRRLYEVVVASDGPVGRDAAAQAVGISRALAAFHLDRLVSAGLLDVHYRRLNGRTGPGAGRPAKLYARAAVDVRASYPPREYGQAAAMLAEAVERLGADGRASAGQAAHESGLAAGTAARLGIGPRASRERRREQLIEVLREASFEPRVGPDKATIRLRNCPYHALVSEHRELTCAMNQSWADGLLDGLGDTGLTARLAPSEGYCCVVFTAAEPPA